MNQLAMNFTAARAAADLGMRRVIERTGCGVAIAGVWGVRK